MSETTATKKPGLLKRFLAYYRPHMKIFSMDMGASLLVSLICVLAPHRVMALITPNPDLLAREKLLHLMKFSENYSTDAYAASAPSARMSLRLATTVSYRPSIFVRS